MTGHPAWGGFSGIPGVLDHWYSGSAVGLGREQRADGLTALERAARKANAAIEPSATAGAVAITAINALLPGNRQNAAEPRTAR